MKRGAAEASIDAVSTNMLKVASADHPMLHPPDKSAAKSTKKAKESKSNANDESALLPSDSD